MRGRCGSYQLVVFQLFGVDAIGVPDASVHLSYSYTLGPETVQVTHGVQAHVTEALKHERESPTSFRIHWFGHVKKLVIAECSDRAEYFLT